MFRSYGVRFYYSEPGRTGQYAQTIFILQFFQISPIDRRMYSHPVKVNALHTVVITTT